MPHYILRNTHKEIFAELYAEAYAKIYAERYAETSAKACTYTMSHHPMTTICLFMRIIIFNIYFYDIWT